MPRPMVNGYNMDKAAHISIDNIIYDWFNYILKDGEKPEIIKDRVNYQVMGTNQWAHSSTIESMADSHLKLYLNLNESNKGLKIAQNPSLNLTHKEQVIDFKDRTTINNSIRFNILNKKVDQGGGIKLVSEPFEESFDISGMFSGTLNVEINKKDMDFVVVLHELLPNGQYFKLSHFKGRASYLSSSTNRQLLTPQKKEKLMFSNTHIVSKRIMKGSRLVVVINGNKNQHDQINYGTGKVVNDESIADAEEPLRIKWFNDSFINIPIRNINQPSVLN
jgi:predicted acyl esterase